MVLKGGGQVVRVLASYLAVLGLVSANSTGCAQDAGVAQRESGQDGIVESKQDVSFDSNPDYARQNKVLVDGIKGKGVSSDRVLEALASVPRHAFVPDEFKSESYDDNPLPIGEGQTISQPFIVAYMTEALDLKPADRVLEIGTGSGYQACVLAKLAKKVYSIEIIPSLSAKAKKALSAVGVDNVELRTGDGYQGWPEEAPFDAIIVTAAPPEIPKKLIQQLKEGGRLIAPVGKDGLQWLVKVVKQKGGVTRETLLPVRFVPMVPAN